jgi:hypothetical protein
MKESLSPPLRSDIEREPTGTPRAAPLRIGVLLNKFDVSFWVHELVRKIIADPDLDLCFAVVNRTAYPTKPVRPLHERIVENNLLFNRFAPWDEARAREFLAAYPRADLTGLLADTPIIEAAARITQFSDRFDTATLARIRAHRPDIILRFGFRILRGDILRIPTYGVWSYHHGDNRKYRGGPAGFWELVNGDPESGVTLQVLTETLDAGRVLGRVFRRTHRTSPAINRFQLMRSGIILLDYAIDRLKAERPSPEAFTRLFAEASDADRSVLYRAPDNKAMLKAGMRILSKQLSAKLPWRRALIQWSVGLVDGPIQHPSAVTERPVRWIEPPSGRFLADPFLARKQDDTCVFVEEYDYATSKAHISVIEIDGERTTPPEKVLEAPYHLSFPCVFVHEGEHFMIPEQSRSGQVCLYRCVSFPYRWKLERVLLDGVAAADPVLFERDGFWWLFLSRAEYSNYDNNLHIYYATDLGAPFRRHPRNPVKCTLEGARMAGYPTPFDGKLVRPAQNCLHQYGGSMIFHRIDRLTPEEYAERELCRVESNQTSRFGHGIHTFSALDDLAAIDGYRLLRRAESRIR